MQQDVTFYNTKMKCDNKYWSLADDKSTGSMGCCSMYEMKYGTLWGKDS